MISFILYWILTLKGDNIEYYLEIDENIFSSTYKNKKIFIPQFPNGEKIGLAKGKILPNDNYNKKYIIHSIGTDGGSSGSPLLLTKNKKLIAVHKGRDSQNQKYAIPMNIIVNSIFSIVCVYNITEKHARKEVQIINDKYYDYYLNEFKCVNNQLENHFKIIINGKEETLVTKYKFKKEGKYIISFLLSSKSALINMNSMFYMCDTLCEINLSFLKNAEITDMSNMFYGCSSLQKIDFFSLQTDKVKDMSYIFFGCSSLEELDLRSLKTENVINMENMFNKCSSLITLDLTNFKTDKVKNMSDMFNGCTSLKELNLNFNVENVTKLFKILKKNISRNKH